MTDKDKLSKIGVKSKDKVSFSSEKPQSLTKTKAINLKFINEKNQNEKKDSNTLNSPLTPCSKKRLILEEKEHDESDESSQPSNKNSNDLNNSNNLNQPKKKKCSNSAFDNLLLCPKCKEPFDLTQRLPKVLSCSDNLCSICVLQLPKNSDFKCKTCKNSHKMVGSDFSLNPTLVEMIKFKYGDPNDKNINENLIKKIKQYHENYNELKEKLKTYLDNGINQFKAFQIDSSSSIEKLIQNLQEKKNEISRYYEQSLIKVTSLNQNEDHSLELEQAFDTSMGETNNKVLAEKAKLIEMKMKKFENFVSELAKNIEFLFNDFKNKQKTIIPDLEIFNNKEVPTSPSTNDEDEKESSSTHKLIQINDVCTKQLFPINLSIFLRYFNNENSEDQLAKTKFQILDRNNNILDEIGCEFSYDQLELIGSSIEFNSFIVYFTVKNIDNTSLIVKYINEKLSFESLTCTRKIVYVNSKEVIVYSRTKKNIFVLSNCPEHKLKFVMLNTSQIDYTKLDFKILGTSESFIILLQGNEIKTISKHANAVLNTFNLGDGDDLNNILVDLNLKAVILNKKIKRIKLIDLEKNEHKEIPLSVKIEYDNIKLTNKNQLVFIDSKKNLCEFIDISYF